MTKKFQIEQWKLVAWTFMWDLYGKTHSKCLSQHPGQMYLDDFELPDYVRQTVNNFITIGWINRDERFALNYYIATEEGKKQYIHLLNDKEK